MDGVIELGPLVLATDRLVAALAIVAFLATPRLWPGVERDRARSLAAAAVVAGVLAARAAWVATHGSAYADAPWTALYFWQGGFRPWPGVVVAGLVLLVGLGPSRRAAAPLAALALVAAIALGTLAALGRDAVAPWPRGLVVATLDGAPVPLDALAGRPFVVNLWATWCPPCRREMPMLVAAARRHRDVPILLVNQGEDAATVHAWLAASGLAPGLPAGTLVLDEGSRVGGALGSAALPTTVFVAADGTIRARRYGEISRAALDAGIAALAPR